MLGGSAGQSCKCARTRVWVACAEAHRWLAPAPCAPCTVCTLPAAFSRVPARSEAKARACVCARDPRKDRDQARLWVLNMSGISSELGQSREMQAGRGTCKRACMHARVCACALVQARASAHLRQLATGQAIDGAALGHVALQRHLHHRQNVGQHVLRQRRWQRCWQHTVSGGMAWGGGKLSAGARAWRAGRQAGLHGWVTEDESIRSHAQLPRAPRGAGAASVRPQGCASDHQPGAKKGAGAWSLTTRGNLLRRIWCTLQARAPGENMGAQAHARVCVCVCVCKWEPVIACMAGEGGKGTLVASRRPRIRGLLAPLSPCTNAMDKRRVRGTARQRHCAAAPGCWHSKPQCTRTRTYSAIAPALRRVLSCMHTHTCSTGVRTCACACTGPGWCLCACECPTCVSSTGANSTNRWCAGASAMSSRSLGVFL